MGRMVTQAGQAALDLVPEVPAGRLVEVAIDSAGGAGTRTYTYSVPTALDDLLPGEAVLVEFGKRQALGVVLAEAASNLLAPGVAAKPILERVRADGPLLPALTIGLARWIADHLPGPGIARHPRDAAARSPRAPRAGRRADRHAAIGHRRHDPR